jgi:hypothetical protein
MINKKNLNRPIVKGKEKVKNKDNSWRTLFFKNLKDFLKSLIHFLFVFFKMFTCFATLFFYILLVYWMLVDPSGLCESVGIEEKNLNFFMIANTLWVFIIFLILGDDFMY